MLESAVAINPTVMLGLLLEQVELHAVKLLHCICETKHEKINTTANTGGSYLWGKLKIIPTRQTTTTE